MPEMLQFAGKQLRVSKRAFKTCDQVKNSGMYRMERTVHLEGVRCDGSAHGGCTSRSLIFWKEGWLKQRRARRPGRRRPGGPGHGHRPGHHRDAPARDPARRGRPRRGDLLLPENAIPEAAPTHIPGWDVREYLEDVTSGNARPLPVLKGLAIHLFNKFQWANRKFLPRFLLINGGRGPPLSRAGWTGAPPRRPSTSSRASWSR